MDREELHRQVELLRTYLRDGKLKFSEEVLDGFERSLLAVREDPDGLVDPDSVDGRIRALLTVISDQEDRREWKEAVSLRDIQEEYFERLDHMFGQPYQMMLDGGGDPAHFASWFASDPDHVKETIGAVDSFCSEIIEFWENISEPAWVHLQDSFDKKAVFSGEIFPNAATNVASSTGIYFDTTVLPDPFVKMTPILRHMDQAERCREILRLGLQVLQYKSLALADVGTPIVAILPDRHNFEESYQQFIHTCAQGDTLQHAGRIFGQSFDSTDELLDYLQHFSGEEALASALRRPGELIFATEWDGALAEHIRRYVEEQGAKLGISSPGEAVYANMISRFSQANDSFQRSRDLMGTPVIRAETSWRWFDWMLRNNAYRVGDGRMREMHISKALQSAMEKEIPWLGNVPPQALIEIRKAGALEEIRGILGQGLGELVSANPGDFLQTGSQVIDNFKNALADHESKVRTLRSRRWKFAGQDLGSFVVVGGVEVAAAVTGIPLFGLAAVTAGMSGLVPTAKDLKEKVGDMSAEQTRLESTGVGLLLKYQD